MTEVNQNSSKAEMWEEIEELRNTLEGKEKKIEKYRNDNIEALNEQMAELEVMQDKLDDINLPDLPSMGDQDKMDRIVDVFDNITEENLQAIGA